MTHAVQTQPWTGEQDRALLSELRTRLSAADCFTPAVPAYALRISLISAAYFAGYVGLLCAPGVAQRLCFAALVAVATVQAGFIAHDVGDGAVTRNPTMALLLRHYLMSFMSALSSSYFNVLHRGHHIRLHRGLGAAGHRMENVNPYEVRWLKRLFAWNGFVFGAAMIGLRGLAFKLESINFIRLNWAATRLDRIMILLHIAVWLIAPIAVIGFFDTIINYLVIILIGGTYIGTVLVLNHEGMSKVDTLAHLPVLSRTLASTRDLGGSWLAGIVLGGVNNHIEHHLFPAIPVVRLAQARLVTETLLHQNGLPHISASCPAALKSAFGHFRSLSREDRITQALS